MAVVAYEMQNFCLCSTGAVYHAMYVRTHLVQDTTNDRGIGAGRGEHQLTGINGGAVYGVGQLVFTAIHKVVRNGGVETFGIELVKPLLPMPPLYRSS